MSEEPKGTVPGIKTARSFPRSNTKARSYRDLLVWQKGMTLAKAIYGIDGTKLSWCTNAPGKDERPKALPAPGTDTMGHLSFIFEREKK